MNISYSFFRLFFVLIVCFIHQAVVAETAHHAPKEQPHAPTAQPKHDTSHPPAQHWGYTGNQGPHAWGDLQREFSTCKTGKFQSPVDISPVTIGPMPNIRLQYKSSTIRVINNGHTIKVEYDAGSFIRVGGNRYQLLQFHFHSPSEHTFGGKAYPMVAHLVHQARNGQLGVMAVLFIEGRENAFLAQFWKNLPKHQDEKFVDRKTKINMKNLLPRRLQYFNYIGSLTTPPCSEGVNWMVLSHPVEASRKQIDEFLALFPESTRPVTPLNGRVVILKN